MRMPPERLKTPGLKGVPQPSLSMARGNWLDDSVRQAFPTTHAALCATGRAPTIVRWLAAAYGTAIERRFYKAGPLLVRCRESGGFDDVAEILKPVFEGAFGDDLLMYAGEPAAALEAYRLHASSTSGRNGRWAGVRRLIICLPPGTVSRAKAKGRGGIASVEPVYLTAEQKQAAAAAVPVFARYLYDIYCVDKNRGPLL